MDFRSEAGMCQRILEKLPSMTAEERLQLRQNCLRAIQRSRDMLIVQEAKRVLAELDVLEQREWTFIVKLPTERRIEYAFRRLPANERERRAIRLLHEHQDNFGRLTAAGAEIETSSWHRDIANMCRDRRHLLTLADGSAEPDATSHDNLADRLIDVQDEGRTVRLKPEAAAAFTRLGYVSQSVSARHSTELSGH
jgi:hypothetical protein